MKSARELLGEKIKDYREGSGLSVLDLVSKTGDQQVNRTFVYDIEAGRKNFTVDHWEKLLRALGVPPEKALSGFKSSDIPKGAEDLYRMLKIIVESGDDDLILGVRVNLDAVADKALRLRKQPPNQPTPVSSRRARS